MLQNKTTIERRKLIFKEGEPAEKLYMVKSGEVLCLKRSQDRLVPIFTARENDIIGENAMMPDQLNSYSAISNSQVELIEIPASNFSTVFNEAPEWLVELTSTMISRFQNTASLVAENRLVHPAIIDEAKFTDAVEVELKKIIDPKPAKSNKTE